MFKRKDKQDVIHQTNIKRGITSHFARTLKVLQQRHLQSDSDEFIYSDDYSNNLCSALEAVFLHGLKDSVVTKMSSYVGLASAQDQVQYINFWGICAKFTHSDVITQLRSLAQINTDIGLCRAWVRLALNDGLMESYLHSMMVDRKVLTYYYHSHSYLRDHEQPGILKNFLTGLMSLSFKLSFNSSVLNGWNNTSLQLAGLLDSRQVPHPAMSKGSTDPSTSIESQRESEMSQSRSDEPIIVNKKTSNLSNDVTSHDGFSNHPMFSSIQDVEEIRRITMAKMGLGGGSGVGAPRSVTSEGSTSSHISCPDPGSIVAQHNQNTKLWEREPGYDVISPALYPRGDAEEVSSSTVVKRDQTRNNILQAQDADVQSIASMSESTVEEQNRRGSKTSSVIVEDSSPFFELEIAMSPPRPRSRRVMDDDLKTLSPASAQSFTNDSTLSSTGYSISNSPKPSDFAVEEIKNSTTLNAMDEVDGSKLEVVKIDGDNSRPGSSEGASRNRGTTFRGYEEICATLPPIKLDPVEQEAILKKVLGEIDEQADREREKLEEQRMNMSYDEAFVDLKPTANLQKRQENDKNVEKEEKFKGGEKDFATSISTSVATSQFKEDGDVKRETAKFDKTLSNVKNSPKHSPISPKRSPNLPKRSPNSPKRSPNSPKRSPDHKDVKSPVSEVATASPTVAAATDTQDDDESNDNNVENEEIDTIAVQIRDEDESSPISGNFGNSLSGMMGWSSEIDSSPVEKGNSLREKTRGESFASMLKTYAGQKSLISTTLDQVIQTFYGDQNEGINDNSPPSPAGLSAGDDAVMVERQDSCLEDFEVLSPTSDLFYNLQESDTSRSIFLFRIPREHGLSHQNFICRGCSRPIGIIYGQPRLCEFDGGLYCYECHENNDIVIPSYIVYNWDFGKRKVAVENLKFLQALEDQALYDLDELNPKLETHIPEIGTIKVLRHQLCFLKSYMFNCTQKVAESLRQKVWPREHLYERASVYSVNDFHQVQSGVLMRFVKDLVKFASKHVYQCSLCSQKGFVCEICRNPQVIFPFELDTTIRCSTCKSVYHKTCMTETLPCPKCERWGRRNSHKGGEENHPEDYGMSPSF